MVTHACVMAMLLGVATGQSPLSAQDALVSDSHAVAGLMQLSVVLLTPQKRPDTVQIDATSLRASIVEKLGQAGIKAGDDGAGSVPRLVVRVEGTVVPDSDRCAYRVQAALIRLVILPNLADPPIPAEVWQSKPVMAVVPRAALAEGVHGAIQGQIDAFLASHKAARRALDQEHSVVARVQAERAMYGPPSPPALSGCPFVSSKSSEIFHRPDCRWAQDIAADNLIGYKSRAEAVQAGKRPCRTCKP